MSYIKLILDFFIEIKNKIRFKLSFLYLRYILILCMFLMLGGSAYFFKIHFFCIKDSKKIRIEICNGETLKGLTSTLYEKKIIQNKTFFYAFVRLIDLIGYKVLVKQGFYDFKKCSSIFEVIGVIQGNASYRVITIPEGFNIFEIATLLVNKGLIKTKSEFFKLVYSKEIIKSFNIPANSLEGYLYPSTYYLSMNDNVRTLVIKMLETFNSKFSNSFFSDAYIRLGINKHNLITLASLIEEETSISDERSIISSVFNNRLRLKKKMECDPTVVYALLLKGNYKGYLSRKRGDLDVISPYNTYKNIGLPPTPISNPGFMAVYAAANPADTPYLFFVVLKGSRHIFSRTFKEHKINVQNYRRYVNSKNLQSK